MPPSRRITVPILALSLGACAPGGVVIVRQIPTPRPVPVALEPLEVDIARPHNGKLFVQTNRPAYVAIFEIVPERGVALVYPVSVRQRTFVVSGLREVPVWWEGARVTYHVGGLTPARSRYTRYIYAVASDEPLRLPEQAFRNDYFREALGARTYLAANPYATMRALARHVVPVVADERWAEEAHALSRSYATERYRVTRVYCRDGSVYEVPAELADRVWCGAGGRGPADGRGPRPDAARTDERRSPVRPDSVVHENGRRAAVRVRATNERASIDRVIEPVEPANGGRTPR